MKNTCLIVLVSIFLIQCDTLSEKPKDFLATDKYYNTAKDAESALNAVYAGLTNSGFYQITFMLLIVGRTDYVNSRGSQAPISQYDKALDPTNLERISNVWNALYENINRANMVLDNVPNIDMDKDEQNKILAQAKVLRAFFYFNLVKYWGGIPLRTQATKNIDDLGAPRASVGEVYDLIKSDLSESINNLPDSYSSQNSGRVTVWAAKIMLADVYMHTGEWEKARDLANEVIESGPYQLVKINQAGDYMEIYGPDVTTYSEDIFSIHYSETNTNSLVTWEQRPGKFGVYGPGGVWAWVPNLDSFIGDWSDQDLRKQFGLYSSVVIDGEIVPLPDISPVLFRKYQDPESTSGSRNNIPMYRLSDAYLIYAEAANETEGAPSALALRRLNTIKRRAYGYNLNSPSPVDYSSGLSKEAFKDSVILERAHEFLIEGKRWDDLLRTGKAKQKIEATGKNFSNLSLLFPIPLEELNANPDLSQGDQNPGY